MNYYNQYNQVFFNPVELKKLEEKRKIKKVSNLVGAVFIILWLVPQIISTMIVNVAALFGAQRLLAPIFSDPAFLMVYQTVISILMFTLPFIILPLGSGKSVSQVANIKKPKKSMFLPFVLMGSGVSAFANLMTNSVGIYFETFGIHFESPQIEYPEGLFGFALSFIAVAVTPAFVEEFATRGMVMGTTREFGQAFALACSSVFFSLMHGNLVQIPFALIMGAVIGFAVIKTGSLITGMAIHFINNGFAVILSYLTEAISSVILQNIISLAYVGLCAVLLCIGLLLALKADKSVFSLEKSDSVLTFGEKMKLLFTAPTIIVSLGLTVIDCLEMISFT
ncbi:MAG: CPBP family intramembrane metalloprotease [Clostridia bacterium]|nr:CPBP family intramembrane metalloprotease [Clostridia bacterium]